MYSFLFLCLQFDLCFILGNQQPVLVLIHYLHDLAHESYNIAYRQNFLDKNDQFIYNLHNHQYYDIVNLIMKYILCFDILKYHYGNSIHPNKLICFDLIY